MQGGSIVSTVDLRFQQKFALLFLRLLETQQLSHHRIFQTLQTGAGALMCRLLWGNKPQRIPPVRFPESWQRTVCTWWGWWLASTLARDLTKLTSSKFLSSQPQQNSLLLGESFARKVLGVIELHQMTPAIGNTREHVSFLELFAVACLWSHRIHGLTQGNDNGLMVLETYLEKLEKRIGITSKDLDESDNASRHATAATLFHAWCMLHMYKQHTSKL